MNQYKLILILLTHLCLCDTAFSQVALKRGDSIPDLTATKILNHTLTRSSLKSLQQNITIIDFFGTWCVPCLKALPSLKKISEKFKEEVAIILVSNESELKLKNFIEKKDSFSFPIIVDEDNQWQNVFQPPALPYTVVIKNSRIIAITEAADITDINIKQWSDDATSTISFPANSALPEIKIKQMNSNQKSANKIIQLSQDLIYAARSGDNVTTISSELKNIKFEDLVSSLQTDNEKKAFWINLYNGYTQIALRQDPGAFNKRNTFFKKKNIEIAEMFFSLDDIEHGIIRHSKSKFSLGYFNKLFPSRKEKQLRVDTLDYRIHFALNCGAKSCPPIAFYQPATLSEQLDLATRAHLNSEAKYDSYRNRINLPAFMGWFRADFGGKKGMTKILQNYGIIPTGLQPKIKFEKYDWTLSLNNYIL